MRSIRCPAKQAVNNEDKDSIRELASLWDVPSVYSFLVREIGTNKGCLGNVCRYLLASPGKGLRPLLVLVCATFGDLDKTKGIRLAAAMELLHMAMLVHDDILDASSFRRGQPSVNYRWNDNTAILTGDYFFGKSLEMVCDFGEGAVQRFGRIITQSCCGEFRQSEGLFDVSLEIADYKDIIRKKTAVMIANCCAMPVIAADADVDAKTILSLESFGMNLGMAFQIRDDVADWSREGKELEEPIIHDLRQGVLTLPLLLVLQLSDNKKEIRDMIATQKITRHRLSFIRCEIKKTGSLCLALDTASKYIEKAYLCLNDLSEGPGKEALKRLLGIFT